jgi:predicted nucleotidyltransferase
VADVLAERRREQQRLVELAREYVERLVSRLAVEAAAVAGSVARGDFNVWSDVDVVVIAEGLPERALDRSTVLLADAPPRVQPIGYSRSEFEREWRRGNPLVREVVERGIVLTGSKLLEELAGATR